MKENIHFFSQKDTLKSGADMEKLGQRGRQAYEFAELALPILPGFIIDSDVAGHLEKAPVAKEIKSHVERIEKIVGKKFGDQGNPMLFKIVISPNLTISDYPTLHNFGLTRKTIDGFARFVGENFASHELLFMIRGILKVEEGIATIEKKDADLKKISDRLAMIGKALQTPARLKKPADLINEFVPFMPKDYFEDAWIQLETTIKLISKLVALDEQDDDDTAILVQPMVYGNYGKTSASGAFFTRNVVTGAKNLQGQYFVEKFNEVDAEGRDINKIDPEYLKELSKIAGKLEDYLKEIRQVRFTIENRKLWLIEQRPVVVKSTQADIQLLLDLNSRKVVDDEFAIKAIKPGRLNEILHPVIDLASVKKLEGVRGGIVGAPGAAIGRVYFSTEALLDAYRVAQQKGQDKRCILCLPASFAEDVKAIEVATGVLSCEGGYSAHASVVARQYGKVSLVQTEMKIRGKKATIGGISFGEGDYITINNPYYGEPSVYLGKAELIEPNPKESGLLEYIAIAKKYNTSFHVRTNADSPRDAALAFSFGAEGIGLCRTEHMFFNEKRINVFREMILADSRKEREKALTKLKSMQKEDFAGLFKVMAGKEVTIRLLDAPLHEFLPHNEAEMNAFVKHMETVKKGDKLSKTEIQARCDAISEFNPMLGHRGCRIAVTYPEIYEMQMRAIFEAAYELKKQKIDVRPEIMIPIVQNSAELKLILYGKKIEGGAYRGMIEIEEEVREQYKASPLHYKTGTMIELPAAALEAHDIARYAQFFSFGTNDLTQTTLGVSRDDFNSFMPDYTLYDLLPGNPFADLMPPVKELVMLAVRRGKMARPDIACGLCGEHGAVPDNIKFCMDAGLDYVSCSPYSVPIATLAVAQAMIERAKA